MLDRAKVYGKCMATANRVSIDNKIGPTDLLRFRDKFEALVCLLINKHILIRLSRITGPEY